MAAAVMGGAIEFLRWNFSPAKIFMGDGGAIFLGFVMATLALKLRPEGQPPATWIVPLLILGVPIFDTTLVSISRSRRGLAIHHARQGPHRAPPLESRPPSARYCAHALRPGIGLRRRGARVKPPRKRPSSWLRRGNRRGRPPRRGVARTRAL